MVNGEGSMVNVPGDFDSLAEAILHSAEGQTIILDSLEYSEAAVIEKNLKIMSRHYAGTVMSDPALVLADEGKCGEGSGLIANCDEGESMPRVHWDGAVVMAVRSGLVRGLCLRQTTSTSIPASSKLACLVLGFACR